MKRRTKVAGSFLILIAVVFTAAAAILSYDSACVQSPQLAANITSMKAIIYRCYGPPEVLWFENVEKPAVADDEVLIRVRAAAVNPLDWHYMRGTPYVMRLLSGLGAPADPRMGVDFAGTVEAVGKNVRRFQRGDDVFGGTAGAFAEYVSVRDDRALALKPANISFEQAASVPVAAVTALQALRDKGRIETGQHVLINGASGGVGTFAVQIAKAFGAEVTGVCSTRNVEMVRSIGADHVIDYTQQNFTKSGKLYDLIVDNVGNHSLLATRRALKANGILVIVGGPDGRWIGPLVNSMQAPLLSPFVSQEFVDILAELNQEDLSTLAGLMRNGKVTPVIDRRFPLQDVPDAIRYSESGRARGKIVITQEGAY